MDTAPLMNSDVDFQDVFGGPPRRSPASAPNRARADSLDSYSSRERGERGGGREEGSLYRRRWSGVGDKPVFGDVISPALRRRHHLGDDFFSDIFHASDSPPSRLRSPSGAPRPTESFVGGSSLPPQLSHSMKLGRGGEYSALNSPTQRPINRYDGFSVPCSPIGNYAASRAIPEQDLRNDLHASYRQSPLSRSSARAVEVRGREGPTWSEGQSRSSRFHFSIYKWAGKGVSLILPSNSEEKIRNGSRLRRLPELVLQGVDVPSGNDMISTVSGASEAKNDNQDSKPLKDLTNARKDKKDSTILKDVLPAKFHLKVLQQEIMGETEGGKVNLCEEQKPKLTNLRQLLADESDSQVGNEDILMQDQEIKGSTREMSDAFDNLNMEQQDGVNHVEVSRLSTQDMQATTLSPENKLLGRTVKGKVKEFIKIFNQEVPLKPKGLSETQEKKAWGKHGRKSKVDVQANFHTAKPDEEIKESSWTDTMSQAPSTAVSQNQKLQEPKSKIRSDAIKSHDSSSQRKDDFVPCFELPPESFDTANRNLEESCSGDLDAKVEHLSEERDGDPQNDLKQDQIQISDVKIQEWSKGKEGNIRSLLSTLQYVLWPDSGWKPVPLVDIIEGNSVKRAYQKALLCLHPDKLQQKGAALHQKYMAEKVFDILQEAWTYFSSVTPI